MNEDESPVGRIAEEKERKLGAAACRGEVLDEDPFSVRRGYTAWENCSKRTKRVIGHRLVILEHAETDGDEEKKGRRTAEGNGRETKQKLAARSWEAREDWKKQGRHSKRRRRPDELVGDSRNKTSEIGTKKLESRKENYIGAKKEKEK